MLVLKTSFSRKCLHLSYLNHLYLRHSQSKSPKIQEKREEQWSQRRWHHRKPLKTSKPVGIGRMERNASVKYALVGKLRDFLIATFHSEPYSWGSRKVLYFFWSFTRQTDQILFLRKLESMEIFVQQDFSLSSEATVYYEWGYSGLVRYNQLISWYDRRICIQIWWFHFTVQAKLWSCTITIILATYYVFIPQLYAHNNKMCC